MSFNDPISDLLTRIRNAARNQRRSIDCLNSKVCRGVCDVLQREGYINGYQVREDGRQGIIQIDLKYGSRGEPLLHHLVRESKPGCRVYSGVADLPRPLEGLGIAIVSTSSGVMSDRECRERNIGGELLATVD